MGCEYCSSFQREGKKIRHMGGKKLFGQIKLLHEKYGVDVFYNQADAFGLHKEDKIFLELMGKYRKKKPKIVLYNPNAFFLRIFFNNGKINKKFVLLLKKAGFNVITLAIDTFNQRFNSKMDFKKISFRMIKNLCKFIKKQGLKIDIYMMHGFPGETIEELENDIGKANSLKKIVDEISTGFLMVFPGCSYYKKAISEKWFTEEEYKKKIKEGYSFSKLNNFFNFTKIPAKKLERLIGASKI